MLPHEVFEIFFETTGEKFMHFLWQLHLYASFCYHFLQIFFFWKKQLKI